MNILGINAYHGDAAACLAQDGHIIAACEEERFRRIKHCAGFPILAIQSCLEQAGISIDDVDYISISRDPRVNLIQKFLYVLRRGLKGAGLVTSRLHNAAKIMSLKEEVTRALNLSKPLRAKTLPVEHHLAHMASSFFASPFEEAALLSVDGFGDFVSTKWGHGRLNDIKIFGQVEFPHSAGVFYTALTQYLGFPHYGDEYKVMGMAGYGEPVYEKEFRDIIRYKSDKGFELNLDYFIHHTHGVSMTWAHGAPELGPCYSRKFTERFGPVRNPKEPITEHHLNLAASLQNVFEEIYFQLLNDLYRKTRSKNLCLSGGCAFNSLANGKIASQTPFQNIFVPPAAGDAGTALGSALYVEHVILRKPRVSHLEHAYLGPEYSLPEIKNALGQQSLAYEELSSGEITIRAAKAIADGKILGWFQGRMEFGPRALGNRSLLADPRRKEMKQILNERIKKREEFRPFAPSILVEDVGEYFEETDPEPFMTRVYKIKASKRPLIPAVTHVDGTGRLQTVNRQTNPKYWQLIQAFKTLTGIPVVLNTSFNENEPIVCTPDDAVRCFIRADMDCLAIGNYWVQRG